jgi:hypothetical protein
MANVLSIMNAKNLINMKCVLHVKMDIIYLIVHIIV